MISFSRNNCHLLRKVAAFASVAMIAAALKSMAFNAIEEREAALKTKIVKVLVVKARILYYQSLKPTHTSKATSFVA